ncbi:MAG: hypothetical protein KC439_15395 [Yoonia sp.]|nr:hypothetical protein [Yoonia sp.]
MQSLIAALIAIGCPVCLDAAKQLDTAPARFNLNLRGAGLDAKHAVVLANALGAVSKSSTHSLTSFSASYNPDLKDHGARALSGSLPNTITALGLVGCAIGDKGGKALLAWAQQAPNLLMICVEDNAFSSDLKLEFTRLGQTKPALMVVV